MHAASPVSWLTAAERLSLQAICETLLPALAPEEGDDPRLFSLGASTMGVAEAMEEIIGALPAEQARRFRLLLRILEQPLINLLLIGRLRRFTALAPADRERLLQGLATSRWSGLRTGFQALTRLAMFRFFSSPDRSGNNPSWPALGYTPSANPQAAPALLTLTPIVQPGTLECDVCVIGSGAGGSVVAAELAAVGRRVVVLEAGSGRQAPEFDQQEVAGMRGLYLENARTATRDLGVTILAGATLGGGTTVNWQTSLVTPPEIRDEWAVRSGCPHFSQDRFAHSLEAITRRLHVGTTESIVNPNNAVLRQGCTALSYHWMTIPRNARGCDLAQCGYCIFGCRHGGKQSTAVTFLVDAQQKGHTQIIARCRAERVRIEAGRVIGVVATATDERGVPHALEIQAPVAVVAAGALQSPLLLRRSGVSGSAVGRHLYLHPTAVVLGRYAERIEPWQGPPQAIMCNEFASLSGAYGFRLETAPLHPGSLALALPWSSGRSHRRLMQQAAFTSALIVLVRDRAGGRVRLGRGGQPIVDYRPGRQEQAYLRQGMAAAVRIHLAAGAREVRTLHLQGQCLHAGPGLTPRAVDVFCQSLAESAIESNGCMLFSAHQMGTCRMGRDARTAVCDAAGHVFGVHGLFVADGSAFPASSGVNPMITIMALAHHTAQHIKAP